MHDTEPLQVVKICGITSFDDARHALASGANALGFNFYPKSPRFVTPQQAQTIVAALEGSFLRVGVFVNASKEDLLEIGARVPLDVLQLHGDCCEIPQDSGFRIWRSVAGENAQAQADAHVEAYLLDTPNAEFGGSGKTFDWQKAKNFRGRMVLAGGLDSGNVGAAIEALHPWGVDACSLLEAAPGKKDHERVRAFIETALAAYTACEETVVSL